MELSIKKDYMIFNLQTLQTKDNKPYLRLSLSDTDGAVINGIMFDSNKLRCKVEKGCVVNIDGVVQSYNGVTQLKVKDMTLIENADKSVFLPKSGKDMGAMVAELTSFLNKNVEADYFKSLANMFIDDKYQFDKFMRSPAAKTVHHAYVNGLLDHTLSMLKLSKLVADFYGKSVNRDLLFMGVLFHDVGKIHELDIDNGFDYTDDGRLLGHLLIGIDMVRDYVAKIDNFPKMAETLVLHLIASHHGYLEFGSPKRPKIREAFLLHYIDNIDAKMQTFESVFAKDNVAGGEWSSYDRLLERPLYNHDLKGSSATDTEVDSNSDPDSAFTSKIDFTPKDD